MSVLRSEIHNPYIRVMDFFYGSRKEYYGKLYFRKNAGAESVYEAGDSVVMSMIVSLVYNMVDTYFIALTGVQELVAGVSLAAPVFTMMIAFGDIFGLGGSSLISRLFGEKREEEAKRASAFCIWGSIVFGICVSAVLLTFRGPILGILGADETTFQYASGYYTWIAIGAAAIIFGLVPSNILRTEGLAEQAMIGSVIGSIVNIILDPIFIFGLKQAQPEQPLQPCWEISLQIFIIFMRL